MGSGKKTGPDKKDPEGTTSMSKKEYQEKQDTIARDFIGIDPPKTDNPEGIPESMVTISLLE